MYKLEYQSLGKGKWMQYAERIACKLHVLQLLDETNPDNTQRISHMETGKVIYEGPGRGTW